MPATNNGPAGGRSRILVVDDDAGQRSLLEAFLAQHNFSVATANSGEEALALLDAGDFDMMISDVRMPGMSGLETLRRARRRNAVLPVLLVTAYADIKQAVAAIRDGAVNYLPKPIDLNELLAAIAQATGRGLDRLPDPESTGRRLPDKVVARGPLMRAVFRDVDLVAASDSRVLITGESGVGKEVVADLIHAWSARSKGRLVKVNCAAIPENLLETELFGHEKGAFSGASAQRIGRFELADQGSIFLDEIAEMSPLLQAKLLRVVQDGIFQRVGSNVDRHTDARVLAATNRNLEEQVRAGRFREDLFYRLNVFELNIPALRERPEDILPLAASFLAEFTESKARLSPAASIALTRYSWPGNVRELRNAMERASLLSPGGLILPEHLPTRVQAIADEPTPPPNAATADLEVIERQAILQALRQHHFNRTETARALGISRRALQYKLQRYQREGHETGPPT